MAPTDVIFEAGTGVFEDDDGDGKDGLEKLDELDAREVVLVTKNHPTTSGVCSLSPPYVMTILWGPLGISGVVSNTLL
jgi:hypothetical protein